MSFVPRKVLNGAKRLLAGSTVAALLIVASRDTAVATVVYCVSTAQELQNALAKSSDGGLHSGDDNDIQLVKGTYATSAVSPPGTFTYVNTTATGELTIGGGFDAGCATSSGQADLTILDGSYVRQVMNLRSVSADIIVAGLTIQNGSASANGGGLSVNENAGDNGAVVVYDSIVRGNHTSGFGGGISASSGGAGNLVNLSIDLIVDNSADEGAAGAMIVGDGGGVLVYDNTVYNNTTPATDGVGGIECIGSQCVVANNIIWGNSNVGLSMISDGTQSLEYNDIGTFTSGTLTRNNGNQSVAPKFVNASGGDYRLSADSTLLHTSPIAGPGVDVAGNAYPRGGLLDMGAYEETIFFGNFEQMLPE